MTREVHKLAGADGPAIVKKIIAGAKRGDPFLQSLFVRHLLPKTKLNPEPMKTPQPKTAHEAADRLGGIFAAVADGSLDYDTAAAMVEALKGFIQAFNIAELEQRAIEGEARAVALKAEIDALTARIRT
jgi:hypothetical protein